jgi:hypothetical protein
MSVFISYSHADAGLVDSLAAVLDELGVEYFRDVRDIRLGEPITATVGAALARRRVLLVVVSPNSLGSHWVPYEIGHASALRKVIVPFLTDRSLNVPTYIRDLSYATTLEQIRRYFIEGGPDKATITRDDAAPQPEPDPASPERRPVLKRENTARQVLEGIFWTKYRIEQQTTFKSLYEGRWVKWTGELKENPRRNGDTRERRGFFAVFWAKLYGNPRTWRCEISEAQTGALIVARTHQNMSELRLWDRVEVEGKIDKYEGEFDKYLWSSFPPKIHLVNAVIRAAT